MPHGNAMLELRSVTKFYKIAGKKTCILDSVDLAVKKGELISITGKSGCGKTTLLNVISGITRQSGGTVSIGGTRVRHFFDIISSAVRNKKIGFIFQTFRLLPGETVYANVLLPARIGGWVGKKTRQRADRILKELDMLEFKNTRAAVLSGGQKQRVAIARALVNEPELILADEPTANLDKETSQDIGKILRKLASDGRAVVAVTHQDYLFKHSDRIFELKKGRLGKLGRSGRKN